MIDRRPPIIDASRLTASDEDKRKAQEYNLRRRARLLGKKRKAHAQRCDDIAHQGRA